MKTMQKKWALKRNTNTAAVSAKEFCLIFSGLAPCVQRPRLVAKHWPSLSFSCQDYPTSI